jgi:hypothetical protein
MSPGARRTTGVAAALDVAWIVVFVAIGRASHADGVTVAGMASTAWPFLAGAAAGWVLSRGWRRPAALVPTGVSVWLSCVGVGMVLRVLSGQGTAAAFVGVALAFVGVGLLGWRGVALLGPRRRPARPLRSREPRRVP